MAILNQLETIKKLDKDNALGSIRAFPKQLLSAWQTAKKVRVPDDYRSVKNLVIAGMGGSSLGARVAMSLYLNQLSAPLVISTEYQLPAFINQDSLVIVASYSGNTEETLSALEAAKKKKAKILAYTTGGQLGERVKRGEFPGVIFTPSHNPLGYPKTAIGYSIGLVLGLLTQTGYLSLTDKQFLSALEEFNQLDLEMPAKKISQDLKGKISVIVASEHLQGAAYTFRNQINEIAHAFSLYFDLPEMNHHLVEGFNSPQAAKDACLYYFFNSKFYDLRVARRYPITQEILKKQGVANCQYQLQSSSQLCQALELVNLGGLTAFYLSIRKNEDPGPEPWILYLKAKLKEAAHEK